MRAVEPFLPLCRVGATLGVDLVRVLRARTALAAENPFLRKQMALYREREAKPQRASAPMRLGLVLLGRCFAWREALAIVQPGTLLGWHRDAFRLLGRWRSSPSSRPRLPGGLRRLIAEMARSNPRCGEERIAAELLLKLGIRVSPWTGRHEMPTGPAAGMARPRNAGAPLSDPIPRRWNKDNRGFLNHWAERRTFAQLAVRGSGPIMERTDTILNGRHRQVVAESSG